MTDSPADWQLPPGVNRGLWDYVHDSDLAKNYDAALADSPLLTIDLAFAERIFQPSGRLLDLGCGTGRLLIPFARKRFQVVGVDLSRPMLEVARQKAAAAGVHAHFLQANIVDLSFFCEATFDYAACLFSTLGMVAGHANRRQLVQHVFRLLRPGGRFILHVHNRWSNLWQPEGRRWLLRSLIASASGQATAGDKVMPVHQGVAGLTLHLFSRRELETLLTNVGFQVMEVIPLGFGSDGRLPKPWWLGSFRAQGYLAAAEKPQLRCYTMRRAKKSQAASAISSLY